MFLNQEIESSTLETSINGHSPRESFTLETSTDVSTLETSIDSLSLSKRQSNMNETSVDVLSLSKRETCTRDIFRCPLALQERALRSNTSIDIQWLSLDLQEGALRSIHLSVTSRSARQSYTLETSIGVLSLSKTELYARDIYRCPLAIQERARHSRHHVMFSRAPGDSSRLETSNRFPLALHEES